MNIYKNPINHEIHCSHNGCPEGYIQLGTDETIDDSNRVFVIGYENGQVLFSEEKAIQEKEIRIYEKQIQINNINSNFDNECKNVGVSFEGNFFQYDDISRSRLQETKDDSRVTFWRSVGNLNVLMDNAKKNELYELLKLTYYTKFAEKSALIDAL